jgi:hypothetical protein
MPPIRAFLPLVLLIGFGAAAIWRPDLPSSPAVIDWSRDLATANKLSLETGRPILVLCDSAAGREALNGCFAHPVIADATTELFVPLVLQQADASQPVVRLTDANGRDLVPCLSGRISPAMLLSSLVAALRAAHRDVPAYLQLVNEEYNPANLQRATFAVGCYWEGEQQLGKLPGVVSTRTGILDQEEVVQLEFDASRVKSSVLLDQARTLKCFHGVRRPATGTLQIADDQLHALSYYPEYRYLPLTSLQATKINAALADQTDPGVFLSPSQLAMHEQLHEIFSRLGGDALDNLSIDRSPDGLSKYAQTLRHEIAQLSTGPMVLTPPEVPR